MANLEVKSPPEFTDKIYKTEREDLLTAELENGIKGKLLNNDVFLKQALHEEKERAETAESGLTEKLLEESNRAKNTEKSLTENLQNEIRRAEAAKETNKNNLANHVADKTNPHKVTKVQVGLGNVDNTADVNKPVSTAQQNALDSAYRQATGYTDQKIADLIGGAPETLDTLKEVADAIKEHKDVDNALNAAIGKNANKTELDTHTGNNTIHITSQERTNWNDANTKKHTHSNKGVLDKITQALLDSWNAAYTHISDAVKHITAAERTLWNTVSNKVDKVSGKGLSSNDYTTAEKNKLAGIAANANNYAHPTTSGNKHIPAGGSSGQILRWSADGTAVWGNDNNTTYNAATQSASGLMSSTDKKKLDNIAEAANKTVIDSALSSSSTNPVQNKVVKSALDGKANSNHSHNYAGSPSAGGGASEMYLARVAKSCQYKPGLNKVIFEEFTSGTNYNLPTDHWYHIITCEGNNANYVTQIAIGMTITALYYRVCGNNSWGAWKKIILESDTMKGAAVANGKAGLVPAPTVSDRNSFLCGAGTWKETVGEIYNSNKHSEIFNDYSYNIASGNYSHAEGSNCTASGNYSHAEGYVTYASGYAAHAEGTNSIASNSYAHAEGGGSNAYNVSGVVTNGTVEAIKTAWNTKKIQLASGLHSHVEGNDSLALGENSHAEGNRCIASGLDSHAEGGNCEASGNCSHAEGNGSTASGLYSHAGGVYSKANGSCSYARGYYATAENHQHAMGHYNKQMTGGGQNDTTGTALVIGNGASNTKSNAFRVDYNGSVYGKSQFNTTGADYAEFVYEWYDNNEDNEDRVGYFVTFKDKKLYKATSNDYIIGIISGNPSVVGNSDEDYYWRYERDEFSRYVMEDVIETVDMIDERTGEIKVVETNNIIKNGKFKQNENYDASKPYVERKYRKEWDYVGMLGVLPLRDDGTCMPGQFCKCNDEGIGTLAENMCDGQTFMVLERVNGHVVKVLLK